MVCTAGRHVLYGLEAIEAVNGWAMAIAGALIVMTGLTVLSFVISQLHKLVGFMERRPTLEKGKTEPTVEQTDGPLYDPEKPLLNINKAVEHYRQATLDLGDQFDLKDLYTIFYHSGFPHPHLTIRSLRENGYLVPGRKGFFTWRD
jgi:hypothetical protein